MEVLDRRQIFDNAAIGGLDACWLWQRPTNKHGYGTVRVGGRSRNVHRTVYEYLRGPVAPGLVLHHTCEERRCVNPKHLVPMTRREHHEAHDFKGNRAIAAKLRSRTHCPHGHPFDEENTYWTPAGHRKCRACDRDRWQRRKP